MSGALRAYWQLAPLVGAARFAAAYLLRRGEVKRCQGAALLSPPREGAAPRGAGSVGR